jgi:hypothetical protein
MQTRQGAVLESLRNVETFLDEHAERLADVVDTGARRKLDELLAELETHASDQVADNLGAQGALNTTQMLQRRLRRWHMRPIARIARSDLPVTSAVEPLKMPKGKPTAERLVAYAEGMAQAAAPFADTFVEAGLPSDFIARLKTATNELRTAVNARVQHRGRQVGATTGLKQKLSSARRLVHVLDVFVETALDGDEPLLACWKIVKRVRRIASQPKTPVVVATSTTATTTSTATTATTATTPSATMATTAATPSSPQAAAT